MRSEHGEGRPLDNDDHPQGGQRAMLLRSAVVKLGDVTGSLAQAEPVDVGRSVALLRIGIGLAGLVAPRLAGRLLLRGGSPSTSTVFAFRTTASRDVVLGLGTVLAARRGPGRLRGWLEASALADLGDAVIVGLTPALRRGIKPLAFLTSAGAAAVQLLTARRLTG